MTDLEICQQLAERVHGWKIAPDEGWIEWCKNKANYPHLAGDTYYDSILADPSEWNPFSSWDDAMGLVRAHHGFQDTLFEAVYKAAEVDEYYESPGSWLLFKATPRDICLAMARAAGIEVDK